MIELHFLHSAYLPRNNAENGSKSSLTVLIIFMGWLFSVYGSMSIGAIGSFPPFQNVSKLIQPPGCLVVFDVQRHIPARRAPGPPNGREPDRWHFACVRKVRRSCIACEETRSHIVSAQ